MALYKVQSPINSALQGMQSASATTAGMTKKQEVKEPKKSFGGALGSMIAGGSYGLGMADMFTGSEATKAMWGGVKGALGSLLNLMTHFQQVQVLCRRRKTLI